MAQADCMTTAIRELMSRQTAPNPMSPVRAAHAEFVGALAGNPPHSIHPDLDSDDLEGRADHLKKVFAALHVYLSAIIADTAQHLPGGGLDRRYLDNLHHDVAPDALAVIRSAAEDMREHESGRAS